MKVRIAVAGGIHCMIALTVPITAMPSTTCFADSWMGMFISPTLPA